MPNSTKPTTASDQAKHAVYLGLSLTSFMAVALFMLVYFNPKDDSYGNLPIVYASLAGLFGIATNLLSRRYEPGIVEAVKAK